MGKKNNGNRAICLAAVIFSVEFGSVVGLQEDINDVLVTEDFEKKIFIVRILNILNCKVIRLYARTIAINLLYLHILSRRNTTLYIGGLLPPSCPTLPLKPDGSAMKLRFSFGKTEYIQ